MEEKRREREEEKERSELNEFFFFHFNCFHEINIKRNILCCVCLTLKVQWMCWVILYMVSHRTVERMHKSGINYKSRERRREVLSHSTQKLQQQQQQQQRRKKAERPNEKAAHITVTFFHIETEKFESLFLPCLPTQGTKYI